MKSASILQIRRGRSTAREAHAAVAEIKEMIQQDAAQLILFFCSADYDLPQLALALRDAFGSIPVMGCTAIGFVGSDGFTTGGLRAISLAGEISAWPYVIDLAAAEDTVLQIAQETREKVVADPGPQAFGLLLVDGMSRKEEELASLLYRYLPQVPTVGGSASGLSSAEQTHVYANGAFHSRSAVFTLFRTRLPFRTIKFANIVPTGETLVVTESDPENRVIREINGEPAAQVYAGLVGVPVDKLGVAVFSRNPFILEMGGEQYVRDIASANPDQSFTLHCAIENGVLLRLGRAVDPVATALAAFGKVREEIGDPALIIACDCVSRSIEFEASGLLEAMGAIMRKQEVFGFSTYGEQFDGLHMNQTFTGVVIGGDHART